MSNYIGVALLGSGDLKREALLFDKIAVPNLHEKGDFYPEVDYLIENGVVYEPWVKLLKKEEKRVVVNDSPTEEHTTVNEALLQDEDESQEQEIISLPGYADEEMHREVGNRYREIFKYAEDSSVSSLVNSYGEEVGSKNDDSFEFSSRLRKSYSYNYMSGIAACLVEGMLTDPRLVSAALRVCNGVDAVPIAYDENVSLGRGDYPVVDVVLSQMPLPVEETPWEDIVQFRSDEDARGSLVMLRRWMRKLSIEGLSKAEIEEEIEFLMHTYRSHMNYHGIKSRNGLLKTVLTTPLEVAENLVKIKWKDAAESVFSISQNRISLMEAELKAPGREISYIIRARGMFGERYNTYEPPGRQ